MPTDWVPEHSSLSWKFLTPVADRIWRVQRKVSRHVQPHEGDNDWVAGCTAYQRRVAALVQMQREEEYCDWLWAGFIDNQFGIRIQGFPIRIYRSPEEGGIPEKYTAGSPLELSLLSELSGAVRDGCIYRIEVLAKKLARPVDIRIVELNDEGRITNSATIPRSRDVDAPVAKSTTEVRPLRRKPPVVPPKPEVRPTEEKQRPDTNEKEKPA